MNASIPSAVAGTEIAIANDGYSTKTIISAWFQPWVALVDYTILRISLSDE